METLCIRNGTLLDGIYPNSTYTMSPSLPHRESILYSTGIVQVQFQLSPQNGNAPYLQTSKRKQGQTGLILIGYVGVEVNLVLGLKSYKVDKSLKQISCTWPHISDCCGCDVV